VIDALTGLPHLQDLQLTVYGGPSSLLQLYCLSGLKKISITGTCTDYHSNIVDGIAEAIANSPELVYLEVKTCNYDRSFEAIMLLHDLLSKVPQSSPLRLTHLVLSGMFARIDSSTLPHLCSLVFLNLDCLYEPLPAYDSSNTFINQTLGCVYKIPDIYRMLNREKIHLKHVVIGEVDDVILDYLQSYSGLETLKVSSTGFSTTAQSNAMGYGFSTPCCPSMSIPSRSWISKPATKVDGVTI
jgi:hypothetical protein